MWTTILVVPGALFAYFVFLRPIMKAIPAFKSFYAQADGIWQTLWAVCGKSLTMAWSYFILIAGGLLNQLDNIATAVGDPAFKEQVSSLVHADPKMLGYFAMMISAITIAARLRSITKALNTNEEPKVNDRAN